MQKSTLLVLNTITAAAVAKFQTDIAAGKQPTVEGLISAIKTAIWREVNDAPDGSDYELIVCGIIPQSSEHAAKTGEYVKSLQGMEKNIAKIILGIKLLDGGFHIPADFNLQQEMEEFKDSFISEINKK